jgi:tetratricopeptide (TPR) repeat protein
MKKITISVIAATMIITNDAKAGLMGDLWDGAKEKTNKILIATHIKNEHMVNMDFEHIYPKEFYKKSYFGWVITGVAVVGAGAFSYFTAGAGAPAAATGVSAVASWVGGGTAGSYMAGLSMIGSWFGGNAMLGAAILNGLSIGAIGGGLGAKIATMGILAKVGMGVSVTALGLDGIAYFQNPKTNQLEYRVRVVIPKDIGSKKIRDMVDKIYSAKEMINDALDEKDGAEQKKAFELLEEYKQEAINFLRRTPIYSLSQEDLLVLSVIAADKNEYELFNKAISEIDRSKLDKLGFLYYLDGLNSLYQGNENKALVYLQNAMDEDKYALEPIALSINILGYNDFFQNETKIENLVKFAEDNFDSDDYATPLSMVSIYYRVGTLYFINGRYVKARQYFEKAKDELSFLQKHFFGKKLKHTIELSIANAIYKEGKVTTSYNLYKEILDDIDEENTEEINKIKEQYIGNYI